MCGAIKPSAAFSGAPPAGNRRTWTGYPLNYGPAKVGPGWRTIIKTIAAFVMLTFVAQIALSLVTLLYGIQFVVPAILDVWSGFSLFLVLPVIVTIVHISGYTLVVFYFLLIAAIVASCAWVFISSYSGFSKELSMKAQSRVHSALFDTCGLLFATLFFSLLVALLANPSPSDVPEEGTLEETLFLLANASVWEELVVRVLLIGVPMVIIDAARRQRQPKLHSYILGGGFKMGRPEVVMILASSIIFGYAHYASGWGAWKIVPATVGGFAFGYLFLKFGLAASIMMHFGTDYLSMPVQVFDNFGLSVLTGVAILLWAAFGLLFLIYYITRIVEYFRGRPMTIGPAPQPVGVQYQYQPQWVPQQGEQRGEPFVQQQQQPYQPRAQTVFGGGYVCPVCGSTQARWADGRFQCLKCGHLG